MIRILLYSRDAKLRPLLAPALGNTFEVAAESNRDRVKEVLDKSACDVLLFDLDGLQAPLEEQVAFYEEISAYDAATILLADDESRLAAIGLLERGAYSYCRRPPALRELKPLIRRAYEHVAMKRELNGRRDRQATRQASVAQPTCDGLIGDSSSMQKVYELIRRVANLNASVLVTGESGTGKELIARAIHNLGERGKAPFVAVSCGAIPETLIESELFGHEKGAFTGTTGTRIGYFEQAANGTLFLDEIGELSPQTQVKLLRVLQQREFIRLGSSRAIPLRARVVLATHRNLPAMIEQGKFRLDLYYRINVMTIEAPTLAQRPADIPVLANHFLKQYSEMYEKPVDGFSPAASALLEDYEWPGNVRELENVIQSAIIRANGDTIQVSELPDRLRDQVGPEVEQESLTQVGSFERLLRDYKIKIATKAIEDCRGNKTLAARSLNISRAYLHRLIRLSDVEALEVA